MIIGISVDIDHLDRYYDIIARNLDIIEHIQFYLDGSPLYFQKQEIIKFKTLFNKSKLTYSLHSYGYINLCETIDTVRKGWVDLACKTIDLANEMHCDFVNYHMGYTFSKSIPREYLLERLCQSLKDMSKYLQGTSVDINIENDFNTPELERLGSQMQDFDIILSRNYSKVKLCYDIGHANIAFSSAYKYRDYIDYIQSFHIHNNWKTSDDHNPFGKNGSINLEEVLADIFKYSNIYFILENDVEMSKHALNNLRNSLNSMGKPI